MGIGNGSLFLLAGPTFGIGVKAESEASGTSTDVSDRFKSSEVGLTIGAAFESGGFVLDGRYTHGLTNYSNASHPTIQDLKSRTFAVSLGLRF